MSVVVPASDSDEVPVDAAPKGTEDIKPAEDLYVSQGISWNQKLIGIGMVVVVCVGIVKYNSGKPSQNVGYEKTQA